MDKVKQYDYLPQLIVAYDGDIKDKCANLVHIKKANLGNDYYCPCCGNIVRARALDSGKVQSHYYHMNGDCDKESQLHWFCKNWLFEENSKFKINGQLFEVDYIDIEKSYDTPFGAYRPDISVHTKSGETIFFELFFTSMKKDDDYFCKWDYLHNPVVEVDLKELLSKVDNIDVPGFTYLYNDGKCFHKEYKKKDLYANTIAKRKVELTRQEILNYKARIEQLDWFWQIIVCGRSEDEILGAIKCMEYDDQVFCYDVIKRKQCVKYLKDKVLDIINQCVVDEVKERLCEMLKEETGHDWDENIEFNLKKRTSRTSYAYLRLYLDIGNDDYNFDFDKADGYQIHFTNCIHDISCIDFESLYRDIKVIYDELICLKEIVLNFVYDMKVEHALINQYNIKISNNSARITYRLNGSKVSKIITHNYSVQELKNNINEEVLKING